ncbi:MAG: VOC family protein [Pseudomonadota bacterium]
MRGVIAALDHVVLICPDLAEGIKDYTCVFGRGPDWHAEDTESGTAIAQFRTHNCALELMAPHGAGPVGDRLNELLSKGGPRLTSLAFMTEQIEDAHHTFQRRGLGPSDISGGKAVHVETGQTRAWCRTRLADAACAGVKTFVVQHDALFQTPKQPAGGIASLDHLVINTPNPERATAHYGARLGLRLALDRTAEQWNTRFLFFRVGDLTLEVIHRLDQTNDPAGNDTIWGITWAVDDLGAAHARLSADGADVSEIRTGRKPGSRVFTLRNKTLGVPTLFIAHTPR